jgi:hypothetical protein
MRLFLSQIYDRSWFTLLPLWVQYLRVVKHFGYIEKGIGSGSWQG